MKFTVNRTPTIMSGLVIRWQLDCSWDNHGEISASRDGVLIQGAWPLMTTREELDAFSAVMQQALAAHGEIRRTDNYLGVDTP